jgi:RNA recognition motif-containing protein
VQGDEYIQEEWMDKRTKLLISNIPASCTESFLLRWVEARGYRVFKVNLIRDVVSGTSPSFAYVQLMDESRLDEAARTLDGQCVSDHILRANRVVPLSAIVRPAAWMRTAV